MVIISMQIEIVVSLSASVVIVAVLLISYTSLIPPIVLNLDRKTCRA